ncbi:MAG: energy transducer TonB [Betaproteobacteria bacterium]
MASAFPDHNSHGSFLGLRARSRRLLALTVALSLGLHLALLVALPGRVNEPPQSKLHVLEVVLVRPEAPPVARTEPPPALEPSEPADVPAPSKPVPKRKEQQRDGVVKKSRQPDPVRPDVPPAPREPAPSDAIAVAPQAPAVPEPKSVPPSPAPPPVVPPKPALTPPAFNAAYLRNPAPRYPTVARRNGEQGTVTLRVLVTREGAPARVTVEQTSGSRHLDIAALEAVKTWRFVPARQGTEPVEAWVLVPIVFRLEDAS